jgi:hypothetical protein
MTGLEQVPVAGFNMISFETVCAVPQCRTDIEMLNLYKLCVLYIERAYHYSTNVAFCIYFSTNISIEYFKHAAHSPFFSSKCRLFHNATFFGSSIIHILHTECAKI